ncbi:hypothetical protein D9611_003350 [Ephemerocybe angulata]|uniref:Uncharacterized protein n=1 Tax=Ephemerocybe angulata TaxID=980116 RepID=A0A8H5FHB9_9AGAR|nr:hypothetical protein D9611_003350 [Tulosesus angulatus]
MSNGNTLDERTPLLSTEENLPQEQEPESSQDHPRLISDALTRIISAASPSLDCLVPSDLLNLDSESAGLSNPEAMPIDYAYALTALLAYRQQQVKQQSAAELDLYGKWTQEKSSKGDVELLDRHVEVLWGQFLSKYRTDQEIDVVLWTSFQRDASSEVLLKVTDFLGGPDTLVLLLTHPLVEAAVARRWERGRWYATNRAGLSLLERIETLVGTPRNTHLLALASHLAYLYLLAQFLIDPPGRVIGNLYAFPISPPWDLVILTISNLAFVGTPANTLYLVSLSALVLPFPWLPELGDGFFDILLLTFTLHIWTLHRPSFISPLYLTDLSKSVPLAGFVQKSFNGIFPSLFYFGPAFIISIVLLSISLEDDEYLRSAQTFMSSLSLTMPAPMETRGAFLITAFVVLLGLLFSIFATTVALPSVRTSATPKNAWDRFGVDTGRWARSVSVFTCSAYDGQYLYPPPFNFLRAVLVVPLDYVVRRLRRSSSWVETLDIYLWRITVLPFLLLAFVVSKVLY